MQNHTTLNANDDDDEQQPSSIIPSTQTTDQQHHPRDAHLSADVDVGASDNPHALTDLRSATNITSSTVSADAQSPQSSTYGTNMIDDPESSSKQITLSDHHQRQRLLSTSSASTATTTTFADDENHQMHLASNNQMMKRNGLPRCAVVNFQKEGDTLRWAPRVSHNVSGLPARVHNFEDAFTLEEFSSTALPVVWHATGGNPRISNTTTSTISSASSASTTLSYAKLKNNHIRSAPPTHPAHVPPSVRVDEDSTNTKLIVRFSKRPLISANQSVDANNTVNEASSTKSNQRQYESVDLATHRHKRLSALANNSETKQNEAHGNANGLKKIESDAEHNITTPPKNTRQPQQQKQSIWSVLLQGANRNHQKGRLNKGSRGTTQEETGRRPRKTLNNTVPSSHGGGGIYKRRNTFTSGSDSVEDEAEDSEKEVHSVGNVLATKRVNNRKNDSHGRRRLVRKWGAGNGNNERRRSKLSGNQNQKHTEDRTSSPTVQRSSVEHSAAAAQSKGSGGVSTRHSISARPQPEGTTGVDSNETRWMPEQQQLQRRFKDCGERPVKLGIGDRLARRQDDGRVGRMASKRFQQQQHQELQDQQQSQQVGQGGGPGSRRSRSSLGDGALRRKLSHHMHTNGSNSGGNGNNNDDQYLSFITSLV